jgi:SulP family sulfate permease
LKPKLFSIIKHRKKELTPQQIKNDIVAGIIVAVIALPLSVALAIASGVTPEKGLVTAIIAGFLISLLGGSRVQIGGPTGAFVVIIYGIIAQYGLEGLLISTILAGVFMILMGVFKLGSVIKYIPYPTTTGFTSGIAVVLLSTQIKDFLGLKIDQVPSEFLEKWAAYFQHFNTIHLATTIVGLLSLLIIVLWPKVNKTIPGSLIALVVMTIGVQALHIPVETIGSRFGSLSTSIKLINISELNVSLSVVKELIRPAITIAFLASIESLLSAVVADGMIGKKHNCNMELIAQGTANIASALFGGIPATGAIARTAANVKNGGRTPIAGIVHAVMLLLIMKVFMPMANMIPMTTLAAILIVVAYNMSEWRSFKGIFSSTKSDVTVLLVTFVLTILFDLVVAIEVGMVIAMFLFVKRMSENKLIENVSHEMEEAFNESGDQDMKEHMDSRIAVYEVNGPLFYGVVNTFLNILNELQSTTRILVLRLKNVNSMDATVLNALKQLEKRCKSQKILILYAEIKPQPQNVLSISGFADNIGKDRFFMTTKEAKQAANEIIAIDFHSHANRKKWIAN